MSQPLPPIDVVRAYATAKSAGDVHAALELCHEDVVIETIPFQSASHGKEQTRGQTVAFLRTFPDYDVVLDDLRAIDDLVLGTGLLNATMQAQLVRIDPTGGRFSLPFACLWYVRDGLIRRERLFFDFHQMCEQLGLDTAVAADHFRVWREGLDSPAGRA